MVADDQLPPFDFCELAHNFTDSQFEDFVLQTFRFQYANNLVYQDWCKRMNKDLQTVQKVLDIPFLPIHFFKTHTVQSFTGVATTVFESSGTTNKELSSKHYVKDMALYRKSLLHTFTRFYGDPKQYCFLGLMPTYLERGHASLVTMIHELMEIGKHPLNGYFLYNHQDLYDRLVLLEQRKQKTILFGVTFGLLDFAKAYSLPLHHTIIIETGGMKGRGEELVREEMVQLLARAFSTKSIHSEYGMTELLSQAYCGYDGSYLSQPWFKIFIRDIMDPMSIKEVGRGAINCIDLANYYSCSFIATEDYGTVADDGRFKIIGRLNNSDKRGCNMLYTDQ
ncbi:MAG: hypothetical protein QM528_04200 [Phycisphaerales bacterium]|nr:hypothetical protein [Phycisphaerales bacterium]